MRPWPWALSEAMRLREFIQEIQDQVGPKVEVFDERYSSLAARKQLSAQGLSAKDQRGLTDNLAAQMMLQQYLETQTQK